MNTFTRRGNFSSSVNKTNNTPSHSRSSTGVRLIVSRVARGLFWWPFLITRARVLGSVGARWGSMFERTCRRFITHLQGQWGKKKKNKKARALAQKRRETMDGRGGKEERGAVGREARCSLLWHILEKVSDPRRDSGPSRERETVWSAC